MFQNISSRHEEQEFTIKPVYTGLAGMVPVAVNPDLTELQGLGFNFKEEPKYITKNDQGVMETSIVIYLKEEEKDIIVPYRIVLSDESVISKKTGKIKIINAYGSAVWVTKPQAQEMAKGAKNHVYAEWYPADDIKAVKVGEEELLEFIRNFRQVPSVHVKTELEDRKNRRTIFTKDEYASILKLDKTTIKFLRDLFLEKNEEGKGYKVGVVLGAKSNGNYYNQDVYPICFKSYLTKLADKPEKVAWIVEIIEEGQANKKRQTTDFRLDDLTLREYGKEESTKDVSNKDDMFDMKEEDNIPAGFMSGGLDSLERGKDEQDMEDEYAMDASDDVSPSSSDDNDVDFDF